MAMSGETSHKLGAAGAATCCDALRACGCLTTPALPTLALLTPFVGSAVRALQLSPTDAATPNTEEPAGTPGEGIDAVQQGICRVRARPGPGNPAQSHGVVDVEGHPASRPRGGECLDRIRNR